MAISYRIVQEHGGKIDVASSEGAGSSITISLPTPNAITRPLTVHVKRVQSESA
jgi:signal transduction histidine kinase